MKKVVWHEVAHWLGHDEDEVEQLGLGSLSPSVGNGTPRKPDSRAIELDTEDANTTLQVPDVEVEEQSPRCVKCYSADITHREVDKSVTPPGAWLQEPVRIRMNICTCRSCGYEWDDDDDG